MRYFCRFWLTVLRLAVSIINSRRKETARANKLLAQVEEKLGGTFAPATRKKIAVSYGIYNPMICDVFTRLHGRLTNNAEKEKLIHYFICSSLFDDFTDYDTITLEQLNAISFHPGEYQPTTFDEKAFLQSHLLLRNYVKDKTTYLDINKALYKAQLASKKQYQSQLPQEDIQQITFTKGGYSVLLCRHYLDINATKVEEECWYRIGTIIQLTNDLFDIYKDLQDQITTLPNSMTNAYAFEQFFMQQVTQMKAYIQQLPYSKGLKQQFALSMAGIYAFGFIAIQQLKNIQGNLLQLPDLQTIPRKALIVDMEKKKNLNQWFRFTYKYGRL
ncbi:hypothetical protein SAMN05421788_1076 [Filimonas lacunae]|uniref:Phytoene/squalene synthetase n=1 Tax=Filimonas lacunae TaxID=477680 RepID=A0A173MFZ3_9BACT|nr:hypothetical protein [Filimonas lacunae]BAV06348.1 hypothetical protein FLA_2364 [Filimonas lacunae]SIT26566.1 hypothetical protein SAMN05421788_1076 [Filimonas lacunae]